jgi:hypothetical protein
MEGEKNLALLLKTMKPVLNEGRFVFCSTNDLNSISLDKILFFFKENEGQTIVLRQEEADHLGLEYSYISSWITLKVHSSLEAIGLTAAFSNALSKEGISCNVVAAYFHDHIFVDQKDADKALEILKKFEED